MKNLLFYLAGFACGATSMFLYSCSFDPGVTYYLDPRLEPYVERFYAEAAARGHAIPRENLVVRMEPQSNISGAATSRRDGCQRVVLFADDTWAFMHNPAYVKGDSVDAGIENIVFHELGHALLDRRHCDPCESLMQSGYSYFGYVNRPEERARMLDELFSQTKF